MSNIQEQFSALSKYRYRWPGENFHANGHWRLIPDRQFWERDMPESDEELAKDSRWPAFFPCAMCIVTTSDGSQTALERVVGPSIVNRFPYIVALSFCVRPLSDRHHSRSSFIEVLERGAQVAVQFVPTGDSLDEVMSVIASCPESQTNERIAKTGLATRSAKTNAAPVFENAYLVYEARLVRSSTDTRGESIFPKPWIDVGSHRIYFLEITAIQLREDIAIGKSQIAWRGLPAWSPAIDATAVGVQGEPAVLATRYQKGYTPNYRFPSQGTIAFSADKVERGMAIKFLPPQTMEDIRNLGNDEARWPCFFPSSLGMITTVTDDGVPNLMPCGSTTIVSRQPMTVAICISYAEINERYAPRASLERLRNSGTFGCGVAYVNDAIVDAIKYAGNISIAADEKKLARTGLEMKGGETGPILLSLPIHFECRITGEHRLGTHAMFLGEVKRILVRDDVSTSNPLEWCPWADVVATNGR